MSVAGIPTVSMISPSAPCVAGELFLKIHKEEPVRAGGMKPAAAHTACRQFVTEICPMCVSEASVGPLSSRSSAQHAEALGTLSHRSFITDLEGGRGFQRFAVFVNMF